MQGEKRDQAETWGKAAEEDRSVQYTNLAKGLHDERGHSNRAREEAGSSAPNCVNTHVRLEL